MRTIQSGNEGIKDVPDPQPEARMEPSACHKKSTKNKEGNLQQSLR